MSGVQRVLARVKRRRVVGIAAALACLLALGAAGVGVAWAAAPAPTTSPGPFAQVERGGVRLTVRIAPGPYFLSELLPVSVSLTNLSGAVVKVPGSVTGNMGIDRGCGSLLGVILSGGHAPTYQVPSTGGMSCPGPLPSDLAPGRTVSASDVIPLTASGHITLAADARTITEKTVGSQGQTYTEFVGEDPFDGHWPTLQLTVSSHVPLDRIIVLTRFGTRVYIGAPPAAWGHLVYLYSRGANGCVTGNYAWAPIKTPWVDYLPTCGQYGMWTYAVGAPGYAIAQGSISG